jgi:hypothetical protein
LAPEPAKTSQAPVRIHRGHLELTNGRGVHCRSYFQRPIRASAWNSFGYFLDDHINSRRILVKDIYDHLRSKAWRLFTVILCLVGTLADQSHTSVNIWSSLTRNTRGILTRRHTTRQKGRHAPIFLTPCHLESPIRIQRI